MAVIAQNHRHMAKSRHRQPKSLVDQDLARRVRNMIVPAQNMGNTHFMIINHNGHVIGWRAIGALDNHIVKLAHIHGDSPLDHVVKNDFALMRNFQAHAMPGARAKAKVAAMAIIARLLPELFRLFAHGVHFLARA